MLRVILTLIMRSEGLDRMAEQTSQTRAEIDPNRINADNTAQERQYYLSETWHLILAQRTGRNLFNSGQ